MTLKQLISHYSWLNIEAALLQEYPREQKNIFAYEAVYHQLLLLPVVETDLQIVLKKIRDTDADSSASYYVDVCGRKQTPHVADADICLGYTLHFTPWAEWLSMPVSAKTLQTFSETEIVAHCLRGMTFYAFDEGLIQAGATSIHDAIERIENRTAEEKNVYGMSWEPFKNN